MQLSITVMSGVADGKVYSFDINALPQPQIRIGRSESNEIVIVTDSSMSRHHATLIFKDENWWLQDENSKNGSFIERQSTIERDERIHGINLESGQLLRLGKTWFRFAIMELDNNNG